MPGSSKRGGKKVPPASSSKRARGKEREEIEYVELIPEEGQEWDLSSLWQDRPEPVAHPVYILISLVAIGYVLMKVFPSDDERRFLHRDEGQAAMMILGQVTSSSSSLHGLTLSLLGSHVLQMAYIITNFGESQLLSLNSDTLIPKLMRAAGAVLFFFTVLAIIIGLRRRLGDLAVLAAVGYLAAHPQFLFFSNFFSEDMFVALFMVLLYSNRTWTGKGSTLSTFSLVGCVILLMGLPPIGPYILACYLIAHTLAEYVLLDSYAITEEEGKVKQSRHAQPSMSVWYVVAGFVGVGVLVVLAFTTLWNRDSPLNLLEDVEHFPHHLQRRLGSSSPFPVLHDLEFLISNLKNKSARFLLKDILTATTLLMWTGALGLPILSVLQRDKNGLELGFWALVLVPAYWVLPDTAPMAAFPVMLVVLFAGALFFMKLLMGVSRTRPIGAKILGLLAFFVISGLLGGLDWHLARGKYWSSSDLENLGIGLEQGIAASLLAAVRQVKEIADYTNTFQDVSIYVTVPPETIQPLPYYIRHFRVTYASTEALSGLPHEDLQGRVPDIVFGVSSQKEKLEKLLPSMLRGEPEDATFELTRKQKINLFFKKQNPDSFQGTDDGRKTVQESDLDYSVALLPDPRYEQQLVKGLTFKVYKDIHYGRNPNAELLTTVTEKRPALDFFYGIRDQRPFGSPFSYVWQGFYAAPESGQYIFATTSDDGSRVFVDDVLVVDNGGTHETRRVEGRINLARGLHHIIIEYMDWVGEVDFHFKIQLPGSRRMMDPKDGQLWTYQDSKIWEKQRFSTVQTNIIPREQKEVGPEHALLSGNAKNAKSKIRIAIISGYDGDKYKPMGRLSSDTKVKYAKLHGYTYYCDSDLIKASGKSFNARSSARTRVFQRHWDEGFDWMLWLDSDILFTNPEVELESIIQEYAPEGSGKHVLLTRDWNEQQPNPGAMFIRTSKEGEAFLNKWIKHIELNEHHDDLLAIRDGMIPSNEPEISYLNWVPQKVCNSYPHLSLKHEPWNESTGEHDPSHARWQEGDLLVHVINCLRQYHVIDSESCDGVAAWYWQHFNQRFEKLVKEKLALQEALHAENATPNWATAYPSENCAVWNKIDPLALGALTSSP